MTEHHFRFDVIKHIFPLVGVKKKALLAGNLKPNKMINIEKKKVAVFIDDSDVATIEALHDMLLDHELSFESITLKRARALTLRMYRELYPESFTFLKPENNE
jgi:hypothetical protein